VYNYISSSKLDGEKSKFLGRFLLLGMAKREEERMDGWRMS
jgi:hypothetical protein